MLRLSEIVTTQSPYYYESSRPPPPTHPRARIRARVRRLRSLLVNQSALHARWFETLPSLRNAAACLVRMTRPRRLEQRGTTPRLRIGTGFMGTSLNGYLVLQGNIPLRTAQFKHIVKLLARERLGTRWAKYPFSRCRLRTPCTTPERANQYNILYYTIRYYTILHHTRLD